MIDQKTKINHPQNILNITSSIQQVTYVYFQQFTSVIYKYLESFYVKVTFDIEKILESKTKKN